MAHAVGVLLRWDHGASGQEHQLGRAERADRQRVSMKTDVSELVVERPSASTIRDIARIVASLNDELEYITFSGKGSALREILDGCAGGDVRVGDRDGLRIAIGPRRAGGLSPVVPVHSVSSPSMADGGRVVLPESGDSSIHPQEDIKETDELMLKRAEQLGVDPNELTTLVREIYEKERCEHIRHLLALAYQHHLERPNKVGRGYVEVRTADSPDLGRFQYLDNGRGRGGAHYFRILTPEKKAELTHLAAVEGFSVLAAGDTYLSISLERPDIEADVEFTECVLSTVFGIPLTKVVAVEEVIGREIACSWIA